eukprot:jgi/Ulvmu1/1945/UM012_0106.1
MSFMCLPCRSKDRRATDDTLFRQSPRSTMLGSDGSHEKSEGKENADQNSRLALINAQLIEVHEHLGQIHKATEAERDGARKEVIELRTELSTIEEDRYQLQVALKAAQKQAAQYPPALEKLQEVQRELQERTQQHSMALHGVQEAQRVITSQENMIAEKDRVVAELRAELKEARRDGDKSRQQLQWMKELMGQIDSKINDSHEVRRRQTKRSTQSVLSATSLAEESVEAAGLPSSPASDRYYHSEHSRPLPCTGF